MPHRYRRFANEHTLLRPELGNLCAADYWIWLVPHRHISLHQVIGVARAWVELIIMFDPVVRIEEEKAQSVCLDIAAHYLRHNEVEFHSLMMPDRAFSPEGAVPLA